MAEKYMSETDIKKLLQCSRCKRVPGSAPIYMCKTGHHECSICYGNHTEPVLLEETDGSTDTESESAVSKHMCAICKEEVTGTRNLLAENILTRLEVLKAEKPPSVSQMKINGPETKIQNNYVDCCYNIYGSPCARYDQSIPMASYDPQAYTRYQYLGPLPQYNYAMEPYLVTDPQPQLEYADPNVYYPEYDNVAYYSTSNKKEVNERRSSKLSTQGSVMALAGESSKRPIRCPTHLCGRNIAVAALSHHFCFDHPEVPPFNVDFDVTCQLFVDPEMIPLNYGRCIAILLIPTKPEPTNSMTHPNMVSKIKNSLPLVVMASKLECNTSLQPGTTNLSEDTRPEPLNHGDFQIGNGKSRLLVIWLAGVDTGSSLYTTIQVTEKQSNTRSVLYTGPVMSLRSSQHTSKIFEQGDCLVIQAGILENIVGSKGGFDLQVMVH